MTPSERFPVDLELGREMHGWARDLFPICRSLTGAGYRESLAYFEERIPGLGHHDVPSGTDVFDWKVPEEWNIRDAYIADAEGRRVVDFRAHNLHVVGYSTPIDATMTAAELEPHLYSLPEQPTAIPYVTSYYVKRWGFCLSHEQRQRLGPGPFRVVIDSTLSPGHLRYGEHILRGETDREVLLSTYLCHPSMANNELSGPVVTMALLRWLMSLPKRRLTYRVVIVPETIGSITYLSRNHQTMRERTVAGFVLSCVGDERAWGYLPSRLGGTLADRVARHVLAARAPDYVRYTFLDRGSDERQYCSVGIDLPVCSILRSKYGCYPEYHTSLDDLSLVTPRGLAESVAVYQEALSVLENDCRWRATNLCEPQMGRRGLYPTVSTRGVGASVADMMNILAYADGEHDLVALAERIGKTATGCLPAIEKLAGAGLIEAAR